MSAPPARTDTPRSRRSSPICYPFVRQAGWLASVYPNVFFDLSLTIPHVARQAVLAEAIELAPLSKLLYASDAVRTPELHPLAAV